MNANSFDGVIVKTEHENIPRYALVAKGGVGSSIELMSYGGHTYYRFRYFELSNDGNTLTIGGCYQASVVDAIGAQITDDLIPITIYGYRNAFD